jgi:hypothetical protein
MTIGRWLSLVAAFFVGIYGLFLAAGSPFGYGYPVGLLLFAAAIVYAFWLIKRVFDEAERGQ